MFIHLEHKFNEINEITFSVHINSPDWIDAWRTHSQHKHTLEESELETCRMVTDLGSMETLILIINILVDYKPLSLIIVLIVLVVVIVVVT